MKYFFDSFKKAILRKRTLILLLAPIGEICLLIAKKNTYFAEEIFAKYIFKPFSVCLSTITGIFPFSVAEVMIILCPVLVIALVAGFVRKMIKEKGKRLFLIFTFLLNAACMWSVIWFFYCFGCGINYYRYPVSEYFDLEVRDSSKEELADLLSELYADVTKYREELTTFDENGVYELPYSPYELAREAKKAYIKFAEDYPVFSGHYAAPKCVMLSHLMSYTQIIGLYTCWTMEANVDIDISDYEIGSTMCHELAHLRGFIREDEANFISYMVCINSDNADLRYSGALLAFTYTANALSAKDADLYREVLSEIDDSEIWLDYAANREYWKQFEKAEVVSEVTNELNDTYLKANEQEDGVESYGRVVDLLLAKYRRDHGGE